MKKIMIVCIILILEISGAVITKGSSNSSMVTNVEENYRMLLSEDFLERDRAVGFFANLKKDELSEKIFERLAELLNKESEQARKMNELLMSGKNLPGDFEYINSEDYGSYHSALCILAGKSGDTKILTLLVENCPMPQAYVHYSDDAAKLVMGKFLKTDNPIEKMNWLDVLAEMLKPKKEGYVVRGELRDKIKKTMIESTSHGNEYVRGTAIRGLGDSQDEDVIPILDNIAKNDQHLVRKKDKSGNIKKDFYPIREEAQKAIQKIKNRKLAQ